ncbi:MAG: nuclear transport factor 2 family protein [Phycisphaeraceae bacterium]|nr:nuclear transport factor 2 family protein [Phycisphaeraceae bacterium]
MAKKNKKKAGKAKPAARSKKPAKRTPAKKVGKKAASVRAVKTGSGAGPGEIGRALVEMFNRGQWAEIEEKFWSPGIISCEGEGVAMEWVGRAAVRQKGEQWYAENQIHGASAEGPYAGASGFAVRFRMDVENRGTGQRTLMEEVGVYTVRNGKIVREEFMYGSVTPVTARS